jgi:hypothetical protein
VIRIDGRAIYRSPIAHIPAQWGSHVFEVPIAAALLTGPTFDLTFELPKLLTPREVGINAADGRKLGLAVSSLRFRPAGS